KDVGRGSSQRTVGKEGERGSEEDAGSRTREKDDTPLPGRSAVLLSDGQGTEEWHEEDARIEVPKRAHRDPMPELVDEQHQNDERELYHRGAGVTLERDE